MSLFSSPKTANSVPRPSKYLAIGSAFHWRNSGLNLPWDDETVFIHFMAFGPDALKYVHPERVVSKLIGHGFDCIDVAQILADAGFKGTLSILARSVPRPDIVLVEIRTLFPDLKIEFV